MPLPGGKVWERPLLFCRPPGEVIYDDERTSKNVMNEPLQRFHFSHLTLNSTLADLPTDSFAVAVTTNGQVVADAFEENPDLPGVIVIDKEEVITAVSRRRFLEHVGRVYGVEVYLNRPIQVMVQAIGTNYLLLPHQTSIQEAAEIALHRPANQFYEPIVVQYPNNIHHLLNAYTLLLAQTHLLTLVNKVEQNRRQLAESLQKTGKALVSSLSLQKVTKRILKELDKVVTYERGLVLLRQGNQLESIAQRGFPKDERSKHLTVSIQTVENDVFQRILRTQEPVVVGDVTQESSWQQLDWLPLNYSWLGVPLAGPNEIIGLISLTRFPRNAFSEDDVALALTFAGQAAIALENARLYEQILGFNDQLEQKVAERTSELNQAYEVLAQLDKTKSNFIQVSAHELRTPLTVIKGYTQVLKTSSNLKEKPELFDMLTGIEEGVNRLHRVVNSMLDVAKIDSNTLKLYLEPVALSAVIDSVATQLADALNERQMLFVTTGLAELPQVTGDIDLLKKVFHALVVNAIKFTPNGGTITITGRVVEDDEKRYVETAVSDTGIGIHPEHHLVIFEKFYQTGELALHSSGLTKFMGGGPGLGLAIAKGIISAHKGRIWVESPERNEQTLPGSSFFVCLPA